MTASITGAGISSALAFVPGTRDTWISTGGEEWLREKGDSFSEDGGHTWTAFQGTEGVSFRHMAWISPQCGWAGSFNSSPTEGGVFKFIGNLSSPSTLNDNHLNPFEFTIYPNPTSSTVTIGLNIPPEKNSILTIFNLSGQQLISRLLTEPLTNVDMSGLVSGVYFVKVSDYKTVQVVKFVKQ